tara:strand:- start:3591 stop:3965 length:375 start_codon:yes stop_codon:yes gene_type:complete
MENIKQIGHQGDTQWFSIANIPADAKKVEKQYIAASERSGSFHALFGDYDMYEVENGFVIDAKEDCTLNHSLESVLKQEGITLDESKVLTKKDHRHSIIKKGVYVVGIQNRFDPMSAIKKRVID